MRSTPTRLRVGRSGLKAPPQGTPSTMSRKASASRSPHSSGTEPAGPLSPPGAAVTPPTNVSALGRSVAPMAASSSPLMTVIATGVGRMSSGTRVAVT